MVRLGIFLARVDLKGKLRGMDLVPVFRVAVNHVDVHLKVVFNHQRIFISLFECWPTYYSTLGTVGNFFCFLLLDVTSQINYEEKDK